MAKPVSIAFVTMIMVLFVACSKPSETAGGFDWPVWQGPDGNGQSLETEWDPAAIAEPKILWKVDVGSGYSNVVIQKGRLYTMGMKEGKFLVFCLDAATGRRIWQRMFTSYNKPQSTPTIDGDRLFLLTSEGYLYAIDSRNGKEQWRKDIVAEYKALRPDYSFAGSPVVEGDLVILTANTAGMAVKRDTGDLVWISDPPPNNFLSANPPSIGTRYSTPVIHGDDGNPQAIIVGWNGLYSVNVQTGRPMWRFGWDIEPGDQNSDPIIAGDMVCVATAFEPPLEQSGFLLRVQDNHPVVLWRTPELFSIISNPVILNGCIFVEYGGPVVARSMLKTSLRCLDLANGQLLWEETFGGNRQNKSFALTAANGALVILDELGTLYTADASAEGYKEIARCDVLQGAVKPRCFWTPPVLCNAKIYCRNFSGDLVCIDVSR